MAKPQLTEPTGVEVAPLVSVIVDNYNYGGFLPQAVASVLNQTYENFELIVVDDGSTDDSWEVIQSYSDNLIPILQENSGQGEAFNAGFSRSKGEIICFLDADDYFHSEKLAKIVTEFQAHPEWVQISHGRTSVNREGEPIGQGYTTHSQGDVKYLLLQWGRYAMGITSSLAYRRAALEKVLPIPTKLTEAADTYLTVTVPFFGQIGCINESLVFYRIHGKNRQAHSGNWPRIMHQRELTAEYINEVANRVGLNDRFSLQKDADYQSLKALQQGGASWPEALRIMSLSLQESLAIGNSPRDTLERILRRGICAVSPTAGKRILSLGLRGYLRHKIFGHQPIKS